MDAFDSSGSVWTACPSSDYDAPSGTSCGIGVSLGAPFPPRHSPSQPSGRFPCAQCRTQTRWGRWRVATCPVRSLRLPSPEVGDDRLPDIHRCAPSTLTHSGASFGALEAIAVDELTYQAREARVFMHRRARHASGDAPCHLSVKHCLLIPCLPLTVPFRVMLLTS